MSTFPVVRRQIYTQSSGDGLSESVTRRDLASNLPFTLELIPQFNRLLKIDPLVSSEHAMRLAMCPVCKAIKPMAEELLYHPYTRAPKL